MNKTKSGNYPTCFVFSYKLPGKSTPIYLNTSNQTRLWGQHDPKKQHIPRLQTQLFIQSVSRGESTAGHGYPSEDPPSPRNIISWTRDIGALNASKGKSLYKSAKRGSFDMPTPPGGGPYLHGEWWGVLCTDEMEDWFRRLMKTPHESGLSNGGGCDQVGRLRVERLLWFVVYGIWMQFQLPRS